MADRYFINGGIDNNWGSTANWSATSGGAGGASIPTAADAVFFDANSPNVTVNASNRVCLSLNFTGYTNTITMTFNITVSGNVTLAAAMGIAGTGSLTVSVTTTLTSNGRTWPNALNLGTSSTYTFADNWIVEGLVTIGGTATSTYNGNQITCNGGLSISATGTIVGTTKIVLGGGTITVTQTSGSVSLSFDYAGNITFASGSTFRINGGTHTYVSGMVTFAGAHTLVIFGTSVTFDTSNSIIWQNAAISASSLTITLSSPMYLSGVLTIGTTSNPTITINGIIYTAGDFVYNTTSGLTLLGTGEIVMNGTGMLDQGAGSATPSFPLVIDTTGNITITSVSRWDLGKFIVRKAGSITTTEAWSLGGGTFNPLQHPLIR